jgi:hypothetical protein
MDCQILLNLKLYHCMRPYSGLQDVLGSCLACSVLVCMCLHGDSVNVYAKGHKLQAIKRCKWNLNVSPQD